MISTKAVRLVVVCACPFVWAGCATSQATRLAYERPAGAATAATASEPTKYARPEPHTVTVRTVESTTPELSEAIRRAAARPTAENHRAVAAIYRRLGILDKAHEHLSQAVRRDQKSAAAFEERAQIWRDWELPHMGLGDAHRAVYLSSYSASAHNTLGTLLQAVGDLRGARREFEMSALLDGSTGYALNNLCYLSFLERDLLQGEIECKKALALTPELGAARNNLALLHAASGDVDRAFTEWLGGGDRARASFNVGVVYLASGQYMLAAAAFRAASHARPGFHEAIRQALRAQRLADRSRTPHGNRDSH